MCEECYGFVPDETLKATEKGVGVRRTPRKVEDDPNLESKFKQELYSPAVRDHDGTVEAQQRDTDAMIEDLTIQLNAAQIDAQNWRGRARLYQGRVQTLSLRTRELVHENRVLMVKLRNHENTAWRKFKRWLRYQWEYDIYNPPGRF